MRITQTTRFHRLFALGLACSFIVGDFGRFEKTFHRISTNDFLEHQFDLAGAKFTEVNFDQDRIQGIVHD